MERGPNDLSLHPFPKDDDEWEAARQERKETATWASRSVKTPNGPGRPAPRLLWNYFCFALFLALFRLPSFHAMLSYAMMRYSMLIYTMLCCTALRYATVCSRMLRWVRIRDLAF